MQTTSLPSPKKKTSVGWAITLLIGKAIFYRNKLPDAVETLDRSLTYNCTRRQRARWVNRINLVLGPKMIRRILEGRLNRGLPYYERVHLTLDRELSYSKLFFKDLTFRQRWSNWYGNHTSEPKKCWVPGSGSFKNFEKLGEKKQIYDREGLEELRAIVIKAENEGRRVKAIGSGHALTAVAQCDDYIVCTQDLNQTQRRATSAIKAEFRGGYEVEVNYGNVKVKEQRFLFETSGGTKLHHLIDELYKEGLALINQGGSSIQAISGAISTSTHGSGMEIGPFPAFVKSITLVGKEGKVYRIEPTHGVTDPEAFESCKEYQGITLIQDDEHFQAVQVGVGAMGIIFSLILEVQPKYSLYEERKLYDWEDYKILMERGDLREFANEHRHFEVLINPYEEMSDDGEVIPRKCLVTTRNYATQKSDLPGSQERNYLSSLISGIAISGKLSPWVFNRSYKNMPRMINNSLLRIEDHKDKGGGYEDFSHKVLDQGLGELKFYGYAIEFGFTLDKVFTAVERIIAICKESAQYDHFLAAPFSLRFVKQCPAHLSMMNQSDMCMIELVSVKDVTGTVSLLRKLEREMIALGGVPHWGLSLLPWSKSMVIKSFPRFDDWKNLQGAYGGETFITPFWENLLD
jgi:hypothetical protein